MAVGLAVLYFLGISSLFVFLTLLFCAIVLLHDLRKKYGHIPGPGLDSFIWGNYVIFGCQRPKSLIFQDLFDQYGPVVVTWNIYKPLVSLANEDIFRDVFEPSEFKDALSNGDFSTLFEQRFIASGAQLVYGFSAFNNDCVKRHLKNFNICSDVFIKMLETMAVSDGREEIKMADQFDKLSVDVIAKVY